MAFGFVSRSSAARGRRRQLAARFVAWLREMLFPVFEGEQVVFEVILDQKRPLGRRAIAVMFVLWFTALATATLWFLWVFAMSF